MERKFFIFCLGLMFISILSFGQYEYSETASNNWPYNAGIMPFATTGTIRNAVFGQQAGYILRTNASSTADDNVFMGFKAGYNTKNGHYNTLLGSNSGLNNTSGSSNIFVGRESGLDNTTGFYNIYIGIKAGSGQTSEEHTLRVGTGQYPLLYGKFDNRRLGIDNSSPTAKLSVKGSYNDRILELINSNSELAMIVNNNGNVGIGISNPAHIYEKLSVNGGIVATKIEVAEYSNWSDYVFAEDYNLIPLDELEQFIKDNSHLPNIPAAKEIEENGYNMAEMDAKLLEKIEELTLYMLKLKNENKSLRVQVEELRAESSNK